MPAIGRPPCRRSPVRATRRFSDFAHFRPRKLTKKEREAAAALDAERKRINELVAIVNTVEHQQVDATEAAMLAQLERMGLAKKSDEKTTANRSYPTRSAITGRLVWQ